MECSMSDEWDNTDSETDSVVDQWEVLEEGEEEEQVYDATLPLPSGVGGPATIKGPSRHTLSSITVLGRPTEHIVS